MKGSEAENGLLLGILGMEANIEVYKELEPDNGWGNALGVLDVLRKLFEYSRKYPKAIFEVA